MTTVPNEKTPKAVVASTQAPAAANSEVVSNLETANLIEGYHVIAEWIRFADAKAAVDEPTRARGDDSVDVHRPGDRAQRECQIGDRVVRVARSETRSAVVDGDFACGDRLGGGGRSRAHTRQWVPRFLRGNPRRGRLENGP